MDANNMKDRYADMLQVYFRDTDQSATAAEFYGWLGGFTAKELESATSEELASMWVEQCEQNKE